MADATIVSGRRVAERYRLVGPRGGDAWDAVDETLRRNVVVHVLRNTAAPAEKEHFTAEARTLARLNHRNVVATYDTGVDGDGTSYRVEELANGKPLDLHAVDDDHRLSFASQLAQAFVDAHGVGLAHEAMTSACALVNDEGRVQVLGLHLPTGDAEDAKAADLVALVQLVTALAPPLASPLRDVAVGWKASPPSSAAALLSALHALPDDSRLDIPITDETPVTGVPRARRGRRAPVVAAVAALATAAITAAIVLPNQTQEGEFEGPVVDLALTAKSFDPEANPPTENEIDARLAVDTNATTGWTTERYKSVNFGNLKSGVGLVLQATAGVTEFDQLVLTSPTRGWELEVYVANQPAAVLAGWGQPVARATVRADTTTVDLARTKGAAVLVWISGSGPNLSVRVNEAAVRGRS